MTSFDYKEVMQEETKRPYRLWDAKAKKALPYRCYKILRNAQIGALVEAKESNPGVTIELLHISIGKMIGQYRRRVHDVFFLEGNGHTLRQQKGE